MRWMEIVSRKDAKTRRREGVGERIDTAHGLCSRKNIGRDDFVEQAGKLGIGKADSVEGLELLAKVLLESRAVGDVAAVFVLEA